MDRVSARTVLGVMRAAVGTQALTAPRLAAKTFGLDPERSNHWVTRLFGSRELLLALYLLGAPPDRVREAASAGAVIDGLDVISSAVELRAGRLSTYTTITGGVGAAFFLALGLIVRSQTRDADLGSAREVAPMGADSDPTSPGLAARRD